MKNKFWKFIALFLGICFYSCRKQDSSSVIQTNKPASEDEISIIKNWLSTEATGAITERITISNSLDQTSTDKTVYEGTSMLITIKLSTKATAKRVSEYIVGANPFTTDYLVILMNESGKVMQGTIGQVTPSKSRNTTGSSELIKSILQKNPTDFNGAFMMLTLDRVFLYQFEYENFKRTKEYSVRSVTKKEEATIKSNSLQNTASYPKQNDIKRQDEPMCYSQHLFIFDDYGNLIDAIYLGYECDTPCALQSIRIDGSYGAIKANCSNDGSAGGGGSGGYLVGDITALLNNPCILTTWGKMMSKGFSGELNSILKQTFGLDKKFNLTIVEVDSLGNNALGEPIAGTSNALPNNNNGLDIQVSLSIASLQYASQEYIATIIYHEVMHSYLYTVTGGPYTNDAQHEAKATKYLNSIRSALTTTFSNSTADITKLAWAGLQKTDAFKWGALGEIEKNIISRTISDNQIGYIGTTCQ